MYIASTVCPHSLLAAAAAAGFAGDSYKRKMEDQENGRAAKNPRSHSPDFASMQQVRVHGVNVVTGAVLLLLNNYLSAFIHVTPH